MNSVRVSSTGLAGPLDQAAAGRQGEVPQGQHLVGRGLGPAQQGPQPGQQLLEGEGLDQVVVGPGVEAGHPVGDGVAGGQDEDGQVVTGGPQLAAHLEPTHLGHDDVEHHGIGSLRRDQPQGLGAVTRLGDLVALEGQRPTDGLAHAGVVVHHQDAHRPPV